MIAKAIFAHWRAVTEAASPGPWTVGDGYEQSDPGTYITDANGLVIAAEQDRTDCVLRKNDAEFMVMARTAMPMLLDLLERLEKDRG